MAQEQTGDHPDDDQVKLSEEDLERVRRVTSSGINSVERQPFRPWKLLLVIVAFIIVMGQLSIWVAGFHLE